MLKDFFPTPDSMITKMLDGVQTKVTILEPSAGKGNICDFIAAKNNLGSYREHKPDIDCIEIDPDLQATLRGKDYRVIHNDFLTFHTEKHYDLIVANFPFSEGDAHLERALHLIERNEGELICLVNAETIRNPCTNLRKSLIVRLHQMGARLEFLQGEFENAERKTKVEIALIRVNVSRPTLFSVLLEKLEKAEVLESEEQIADELISTNFKEQLVTYYKQECTLGKSLISEWLALKPYIKDRLPKKSDTADYSSPLIKLEIKNCHFHSSSKPGEIINGYLEGVRHKYWELLLGDRRFRAKYTSNILSEMNDKLRELSGYDFSLFNIEQLEKELSVKIVAGIESAILKLFDDLSHQYAYFDGSKNIWYYNGWKTNKAHKINSKVILPVNGLSARWNGKHEIDRYYIGEQLEDMVKVFNYFAEEKRRIKDVPELVGNTIYWANEHQDFRNIDLSYFDVTYYKKGTCHITFKNQELLDKFNIFGSQRKGWLPPCYGKVRYDDMKQDEKEVVDSFQGKEDYEKVFLNPEKWLVEPSALMLTDGFTAEDSQ